MGTPIMQRWCVHLCTGGADKLQGSSPAEAGVSHLDFVMIPIHRMTHSPAIFSLQRLKIKQRSSYVSVNMSSAQCLRRSRGNILQWSFTANAKLLKVGRGMIKQAELQPLPQDWENRVGKIISAFRM